VKDAYAVLIATRNRPEQLSRLLNSISQLEVKPELVVIVSSGDSISSTIERQCDLKIKHEHIAEYGQIRQKIIGIKLIPKEIEWVLFLDDDLLLDKASTKNLLEFAGNNSHLKLLGLGLAESTGGESNSKKLSSKRMLGSVSKSGTNISYMSSKQPIKTSWLNGASMWKREAVDLYHFEFLDSKYSICEDLIFSFAISKLGVLIYVPQAVFQFQPEVGKHVNDVEAFRARAYWKLYFVSSFESLSKYRFLLRQLLATQKFILYGKNSSVSISKRFLIGFSVYFDLLIAVGKKQNTLELLKKTS
jgi:GT2 family glycosyltransferase